MAVLIVAAPVIGLSMALSVFLLPLSAAELGVVLVAALMAILGQPIFLPVQFEAVFTPAFWEASIASGWMPSFEMDYYAELARYQRAFGGPTGRLPGDALWALSYAVIYLATVIAAIGMTVVLYPLATVWSFIPFAAVEVAVAVICFKLYLNRDRARLKLAAERGFHLSELGKAMARRRAAQIPASRRG